MGRHCKLDCAEACSPALRLVRPATNTTAVAALPPIAELYRTHGPIVLRRARQLLGNEEEAQEVLHDVFASLVQRPEQFRGESSVMTFLYSMTTHAALGRLRKARRRNELLSRQGSMPDAVKAIGSARLEVQRVLASLSPDLAQVAAYYYLDEMTQQEIAEVMGCSRQWVTKLLKKLSEHQEEHSC